MIKFKRFSWSKIIPIFIFISLVLHFTIPFKEKPVIKNYHKTNNYRNNIFNIKYYNSNNNDKKLSSAPKTVLFGNPIDEKRILKIAFNEANTNHDQYLSIKELSQYINQKIRKHIENAVKMNSIHFSKIDISPKDGLISWEEYFTYYFNGNGLDRTFLIQESNSKQLIHLDLDHKTKEDIIIRDKSLWPETARTDPFTLTLDEFLSFRHPESSTLNLLSLVDDLLRLFDVDGDDHLTIDEFSDVIVGEVDAKYRKSIISKSVEERRDEYRRIIDTNKDGKANRDELLIYVDPRHPRYSLQEAATLINITDLNKDGMLSFKEILVNSKIFMSSKMIDTSSSFHDE